jgi:hypothetical protein
MHTLIKTVAVVTTALIAFGIAGCQGAENHPESGVTVQGCVSQSNGEYHLVDGFGHDYVLSEPSADVKQNVGHEVLVRGSEIENKRTPEAQPDPNNGVVNRIDVTSAKLVSDQCSESGSSNEKQSDKSQ